jgi:hypothetical protein
MVERVDASSNRFAAVRVAATSDALCGDSPPAKSRTGFTSGVTGAYSAEGGAATTTCPFEPPIPELVIDIKDVSERRPSFVIWVGTCMLYSFQWIAGLGVTMFTFGGMRPVSKIEQTFDSDARKAVISRWLSRLIS